jgi:hypothetical protein
MRVKAPPIRLRYDSLPVHTDRTRFSEGEAGNRAQSDISCGMTLALMGSSYGETEPKKATYDKAGRNKSLTLLEINRIPAALDLNSGKSLGNPVVELATPNGTNNLPRERIKTS